MELIVRDLKCQIDDEDYEKVNQYKWYLDKDGYAFTGAPTNIKMHHLIIGKKKGFVVDHINHDKLDNHKSNLRHITRQANAMNMEKVRGVYWREDRQKWITQIKVNYKTKHIGCYDTKEEAIKARLKAEEQHFKPFMKEG